MAIAYTEIGHGDPNDMLWIQILGKIYTISAGLSRTHELVWGAEVKIENVWRGRFERKTGRCSIAPPVMDNSPVPEQSIVDQLVLHFNTATEMFYFQDCNTV